MAERTLHITYTGDPRGVLGAIKSIDSAHATLGDKFRQTGQKITSVGKSLTTAFTLPIVGAFALATKAAIEHNKVVAQTEAAIKSTGGAANVSAKQVGAMADKLERMSTVDGEMIQTGQNMLLTFTNIRNEVGKGNDVFDQATKAMLDMSVALGQDAQQSALQLGKALNDPIAGVTALRRVGVAFTEDQTAMIKKMVESGDVMKAQKFILAELNKEFGGSAKAMGDAAGPMGKLMVSLKQLAEDIGTLLLPYIQKASEYISRLVKWFQHLSPETKDLVVKIGLVVAALGPLLIVVGKLTSAIGSLITVGSKLAGVFASTATAATGAKVAIAATSTALSPGLIVAGAAAIPVIGAVATNLIVAKTGMETTEEAASRLKREMQAGTISTTRYVAEMRGVVAPAYAATQTIHAQAEALKAQRDALRGGTEAVEEYEEATRDATGVTDKQKERLRDVIVETVNYGGKLSDLQKQQINNLLYQGDFNSALKIAKEAAREAREKINDLEASIKSLPAKKAIDIIADTRDARAAVGGFREWVNNLGPVSINVAAHLFNVEQGVRRQHGGPVSGGNPYIVGEAGPELFVPNAGGNIVPHNRMRGGGGDTYVTVNVGGSVTSERDLATTIRDELIRLTRRNGDVGF